MYAISVFMRWERTQVTLPVHHIHIIHRTQQKISIYVESTLSINKIIFVFRFGLSTTKPITENNNIVRFR